MANSVLCSKTYGDKLTVYAEYTSNNFEHYWNDIRLESNIDEAVKAAGTGKNLFDLCNFLYAHIFHLTVRDLGTRGISLQEVTVDSGGRIITTN